MAAAIIETVPLPVPTRAPNEIARVILADEMTLVREGLAAICERELCHVAGQYSDGKSALAAIESLQPDIAFLDWNLPQLFALEISRQVHQARIPTRIAVLSTRTDRKTVIEALRAGVNGFLLKSGPAQQISEAVQRLMAGGVYISPPLDGEAILNAGKTEPEDRFDALSPREFQVFTLLVDGVRAKEIAARLGLSPKTVDTYRSSLMQKLEIYDLAGLVKFAIGRSLVSSH